MVGLIAYTALIGLVGLERILELRLSRRNVKKQLSAGGIEYGSGHYPWMVALHVGLLTGCVVESWALERPFIPALGYPMLALVISAAAVRFWVIATLGDRWTTRVVVVPGRPTIKRGPYRFLDHPNYVIVAVEGLALPLVHTNWITATAFTVLNSALLAVRIRVENRALEEVSVPR